MKLFVSTVLALALASQGYARVADKATYRDRESLSESLGSFVARAFAANAVVGPTVTTCLPQLVAGGEYQTRLEIKNLAHSTRSVAVDWRSPAGTEFPLRAVERAVTTYGFVVNMPGMDPGAITTLEGVDSGLKTGSVCFTEPVNSWGGKETEVSILLQHRLANGSVVPISQQLNPVEVSRRGTFYGAELLGVAVANRNNSETTVWFTREGGQAASVTLPPQGQISRFLGEMLGEFKRGDERILFEAPLGVSVLTLQYVLDPTDALDKYVSGGVALPPKDK